MEYKARLTAPSKDNRYYYKDNIFYKCGFGMPNCTCYAWGRFYETNNEYPRLYTGNAETWYGHTEDKYNRGQSPKLGAIACWKQGAIKSSDGAGHVAVVEDIASDGTVTFSNSDWGGRYFYLTKMKPPYKVGSSFQFQGFIYNPIDFDEPTKYTTGVYKCNYNMRLRTAPSTNASMLHVKDCTELQKEALTSKNPNDNAVFKAGTNITALEIVKNDKGEYWLKTYRNAYVCIDDGETKYCSKVN